MGSQTVTSSYGCKFQLNGRLEIVSWVLDNLPGKISFLTRSVALQREHRPASTNKLDGRSNEMFIHLPGCFSAGSSMTEALQQVKEVIECHLEGLVTTKRFQRQPNAMKSTAYPSVVPG